MEQLYERSRCRNGHVQTRHHLTRTCVEFWAIGRKLALAEDLATRTYCTRYTCPRHLDILYYACGDGRRYLGRGQPRRIYPARIQTTWLFDSFLLISYRCLLPSCCVTRQKITENLLIHNNKLWVCIINKMVERIYECPCYVRTRILYRNIPS